MICILGTIFAGLLGLAFGSFLNVCVTRWPQSESIVAPRSHCRNCAHTLAWLENIPLLSWLLLRGRCRNCRAWIGVRYPVVELAVALLWMQCWLRFAWPALQDASTPGLVHGCVETVGFAVFFWLLVGLAALDVEYLWLPDAVTLPAIALGMLFQILRLESQLSGPPRNLLSPLENTALAIVVAAGVILVIRWAYRLIRHREGLGLGDAKLMALLAAWLGLPATLLAFAVGVVLGAAVALVLLAIPVARNQPDGWALKKLPLGTFLCIGGAVSALWGDQILAAYLRWAGF